MVFGNAQREAPSDARSMQKLWRRAAYAENSARFAAKFILLWRRSQPTRQGSRWSRCLATASTQRVAGDLRQRGEKHRQADKRDNFRKSHCKIDIDDTDRAARTEEPFLLLTSFGRVLFGTEKVERDVRLIADDPTIVRDWRNVEKIAGFEFNHATVIERNGCSSGKNQADMFDGATRRAYAWTNMLAPFPARLISRTPNRHPSDVHQFEFPFFHRTHFIGRLEPFQNHADFFAAHLWLQRTLDHLCDFTLSVVPEFSSLDNRNTNQGRACAQRSLEEGRHLWR
jgi:hypothetical protein